MVASFMGLKVYLPLSAACFVVASTGSDLVARTTIAGEPLAAAFREHVRWAEFHPVSTLLLLWPFVAVAFVCSAIERQVSCRSAALIFGAAMLALLFFYFQGHQAAQRALMERHWTAATLSIGFLPIFIGPSVVIAAFVTGRRFKRRKSATSD